MKNYFNLGWIILDNFHRSCLHVEAPVFAKTLRAGRRFGTRIKKTFTQKPLF